MEFTESENYYFFSLTGAFQFIYLVIGKPNLLGQFFMNYAYARLCSLLKDCTLLINPLPQTLLGQYGCIFCLFLATFSDKCRCREKSWIYLQDGFFMASITMKDIYIYMREREIQEQNNS